MEQVASLVQGEWWATAACTLLQGEASINATFVSVLQSGWWSTVPNCVILPRSNEHTKARQSRFIVSRQCPLPLRPATSTVIITFQTMTCQLKYFIRKGKLDLLFCISHLPDLCVGSSGSHYSLLTTSKHYKDAQQICVALWPLKVVAFRNG